MDFKNKKQFPICGEQGVSKVGEGVKVTHNITTPFQHLNEFVIVVDLRKKKKKENRKFNGKQGMTGEEGGDFFLATKWKPGGMIDFVWI